MSKTRGHRLGNILDCWGTFWSNICIILLQFTVCRESHTFNTAQENNIRINFFLQALVNVLVNTHL